MGLRETSKSWPVARHFVPTHAPVHYKDLVQPIPSCDPLLLWCYMYSILSARRDPMDNEVREDILLTVDEVAEILRVPTSWVYGRTRERSKDRIPGFRLGKYWRFRQCEVLAWVESQREHIHVA
jgi:excisionase family DNA binding protein